MANKSGYCVKSLWLLCLCEREQEVKHSKTCSYKIINVTQKFPVTAYPERVFFSAYHSAVVKDYSFLKFMNE